MTRQRKTEGRVTPAYWDAFGPLANECEIEVSLFERPGAPPLHLYEAGARSAPPLIIVSPSESPFLLMSRLFRQLSTRFRVVAWDDPAAVFMDCPLDLAPPTLRNMSDELVSIIRAKGFESPHVVSWCAGALIVLWALAREPSCIGSATFIAPPSILSAAAERTGFQFQYLQSILELASGIHEDDTEILNHIRGMLPTGEGMTGVDRDIFELTKLPVRDEVALRRYARSIHNACLTLPPGTAHLRDRAYVEILSKTCRDVPISLLHCRDDDVVSYKCSADVAARNDNAHLVVYPRGGHFVIYKSAEMLSADVDKFVNAVCVKAA